MFDDDTLDRWRRLGPRATFEEARKALYRLGASSSEDFRSAFEELVESGLLSWDDIEQFESGR
jgi:hypothetical protein